MKKILGIIALTVMALALVPQIMAQTVSAPMYWETFDERTGRLINKVWTDANGNQRIENVATPDEFTINRIDVRTRAITMNRCNSRTKTYTSITINPDVEGAGMVETLIGQEMVEGRMCNHYRITWTGKSEVREEWRDPALHNLPIRSRDGNNPPTVTRNIRQGAQPAHLFEIPRDYTGQSVNLPTAPTTQQQLLEQLLQQR